MNSGISSQAFDLEKGSGGGGDGDELPYRPDFFHAMHGLAACYMLLLFVGWELSGSEGDFNIDQGEEWAGGERRRCNQQGGGVPLA
jgi:hypothetical protein